METTTLTDLATTSASAAEIEGDKSPPLTPSPEITISNNDESCIDVMPIDIGEVTKFKRVNQRNTGRTRRRSDGKNVIKYKKVVIPHVKSSK